MRNSYFLAMAISGAFAGLAGAMDILGWQYRLGVQDVQISTIGYFGIAVAFLGRHTAVGVMFAALLFGALTYGTSSRSLDPDVFDPSLAGNLTLMIQGLVLLFIGADVLILWFWRRRGMPMPRMPRFARRLRPERRVRGLAAGDVTSHRCRATPWPTASRAGSWRTFHVARRPRVRSRSP